MSAVLTHARTLWEYHALRSELRACEFVVGLGSYDVRVADHCVDLLKRDLARKMIFTGNRGNWTRLLWDRPEAEIFAKRALELGVPPDRILTETQAMNLSENLLFSRRDFGLDGQSQILVVTKPNTLRRVHLTARRVWPSHLDVLTDAPPIEFPDGISPLIGLIPLIHEMVGDIQRIMVYPELGYQAPDVLPDDVKRSYDYLVQRGFTDHMIR
jgi:uncharacterized SAM-binding protein YcdF (DUF218 family)